MKKILLTLMICVCTLSINAQTKYPNVVISTNYGDMKVMLYDDTPRHSEYFLKLVRQKYFDGTLFHRVMKNFMIQGGAQDSRNAPAGAAVGAGSNTMKIMPEILPNHYHRKGALSAPRLDDDVNPQRKSDMSQFFIVQGKVLRLTYMDSLEMQVNVPIKNKLIRKHYMPYKDELDNLKTTDARKFNALLDSVLGMVDSLYNCAPDKFTFPKEQRQYYSTDGGERSLDGKYSVYGQVIEGLDVIDKIAALPTDQRNRPKKDAKILRVYVVK